MSISNLLTSGAQFVPNNDIYCDSITANTADIGGLTIADGAAKQDYWEGNFPASNSVPDDDPNYRLSLSEISKSGTSISMATDVITFNEDGVYMIHWFGSWDANATGERELYVVDPLFTVYYGASSGYPHATTLNYIENTTIIKAAAGLQIQLIPYQTSGIALNFRHTGTNAHIHVLRMS